MNLKKAIEDYEDEINFKKAIKAYEEAESGIDPTAETVKIEKAELPTPGSWHFIAGFLCATAFFLFLSWCFR